MEPRITASQRKRQRRNQPSFSKSITSNPGTASNGDSPSIPKGPKKYADGSSSKKNANGTSSSRRDPETEVGCNAGEVAVFEENKQVASVVDESEEPPSGKIGKGMPRWLSSFRDSTTFLRNEQRARLTRLLRNFVDCHDWTAAASTLSILLRLWPDPGPLSSTVDLRNSFHFALELQYRKGGSYKSQSIKQTYETWLRKLNFTKDCAAERHSCKLELALFLMQQCSSDSIKDLFYITKGLLRDTECPNHPKLHLVHGLICYRIWYCGLPEELKLESYVDGHLELYQDCLSDKFSQDSRSCKEFKCHTSQKQVVDVLSSIRSDASVQNFSIDSKKGLMVKKSSNEKFPINLSDDRSASNRTRLSVENRLPSMSIFSSKGLDRSMLPMRLIKSSEAIEERISAHHQLLNDYYSGALEHLKMAVFAEPPITGALLPYIQVLLLGDLVEEALVSLDKFCQLSNTTLPFRLKGRLLEVFCQDKIVEISTCHETVLSKDPTCTYSLERLIMMFKEGNYSGVRLLQMIALHLDASAGSYKIWGEFASCLLKIQTSNISEYIHDDMSANIISKEPTASNMPVFSFLDQQTKRSWQLRCKWWSKHHFSKQKCISEIKSGEWGLLTYKAACASHLYELNFQYVQNVACILREQENEEYLSYLEEHARNSLGLYARLSEQPS